MILLYMLSKQNKHRNIKEEISSDVYKYLYNIIIYVVGKTKWVKLAFLYNYLHFLINVI